MIILVLLYRVFPLQLCADTNLTNMQRQLALEVIVTLSETAAAMLRKHTNIVAQSGKRETFNALYVTMLITRGKANESEICQTLKLYNLMQFCFASAFQVKNDFQNS